jgi:hypothetical protein
VTASAIGSVVYRRSERPDTALAEAVRRLQACGLQVGGLLQNGVGGSAAHCAGLFLEDIGSGRRVPLFENRGAATRGCRLDPGGLAEAAGWLQDAIARRVNVLVVNRFGRQEAEGRGLLDEIAGAVTANIPIVIAIEETFVPAWDAFVGEETTRLDADAGRIAAWAENQAAVMVV